MKRNVLEYLEDRAKSHPLKTAFVCREDEATFPQMMEMSQRVGTALAQQGREGRGVIVLLEKSVPTLAAFFGVLHAGGFYVPVDPSVPASRLASIYETLEQPLVVVSAQTREFAEQAVPDARLLDIGELLTSSIDSDLLAEIRQRAMSVQPCYVLFTSGSTGTPKGVAVSHQAIIDFIDTFAATFGIDDQDILGNQAPFDFDVSVKDIYSGLATGATLCIIPRALFSAPADLVDYLNANKVTNLTWAVSALCLVSSLHGLDYAGLPTVKRVMFSGEVMPHKHLQTWMGRLPQATFVNLYGPTEITCNCTYHVLDAAQDYSQGIPLGQAFANRRVFLLKDDNTQATEPGEAGEICVTGTSVALGYYGRPDLSEKAFVQNPLQTHYAQRMYRTGDLAVVSESGELFFHGRKDNQIKHQGHRIELEEIDAVVDRQDGVERCRCAYDQQKKRIYAFFEGEADPDQLRLAVAEVLPVHMVPSKVIRVDSMPLTKNGKIDRMKLLADNAPVRKSRRKKDAEA